MSNEFDVVVHQSHQHEWIVTFRDGEGKPRMIISDNPFQVQAHARSLRENGYEPKIWASVTEGFDEFCENIRETAEALGIKPEDDDG